MALEKTIDVLGIGNAIIDVLADADDAFLLQHNLNKGSMTLVDEEASSNDKFVALTMLKNANISASGVLPMCQDTGTAIIMGYKGEKVFTNSDDNKFLSLGVYKTYKENNLRFSQLAPVSMFEE